MNKLTLADIRNLAGVMSASDWRDRIYVNIRGNGGNFAGERSAKVWVASTGQLMIERGKGTTSREWDANLAAFTAAYNSAIEA